MQIVLFCFLLALQFYVCYMLGWLKRDLQIMRRFKQLWQNKKEGEDGMLEFIEGVINIPFHRGDEPYLIQLMLKIKKAFQKKEKAEAEDGTK